jgi:hypothetical protein
LVTVLRTPRRPRRPPPVRTPADDRLQERPPVAGEVACSLLRLGLVRELFPPRAEGSLALRIEPGELDLAWKVSAPVVFEVHRLCLSALAATGWYRLRVHVTPEHGQHRRYANT